MGHNASKLAGSAAAREASPGAGEDLLPPQGLTVRALASASSSPHLVISMRVTSCRAHDASAGEEAAAVVMGAARRATTARTTPWPPGHDPNPLTLPLAYLSTSLRFACLQGWLVVRRVAARAAKGEEGEGI